jgi:hypothetical protein
LRIKAKGERSKDSWEDGKLEGWDAGRLERIEGQKIRNLEVKKFGKNAAFLLFP